MGIEDKIKSNGDREMESGWVVLLLFVMEQTEIERKQHQHFGIRRKLKRPLNTLRVSVAAADKVHA